MATYPKRGELVHNRFMSAALAAVAVGAVAGCSGPTPAAQPQPGTLPSGTAQVTVDGKDIGTTYAVACNSIEYLTTITTGDDAAGITAMIDSAEALTTASVSIRDLNGFTGSYLQDLQGMAQIHMVDQTYQITGTADGFTADNPGARAKGSFVIKVAC